MNPELTLLWVPGQQIGYGRTGVFLASELLKRGVTLYNDSGKPDWIDQSPHAEVVTTDRHRPPVPTNAICWITVPTHAIGWYEGQHRSILTMWESMRLPEDFRKTLHEFQTIIVPSHQNLELFSRYHDNVQLCLLGVDPLLWHYRKPSTPTTTFNFLISGRGSRKGINLAYEAFQTVFGHLWTYGDDGTPVYKGGLDKPFPRLIMKSLKGHGEYYAPGIDHVTGRLDASVEADLYASSHCYLQPSRGEGFGLQPLQAMAMGRPTILTNAHGHESFADMGIPLSWKPTEADFFMHGDAGQWWEPDFEELCEAMSDVYNNYEPHARHAYESAKEIAKNWTWERTTDRFVDILGDALTQPYVGNGEWQKPVQQLFPIVTNRDFTNSVAGVTRHFVKGTVYWDLADVKRVLFDSGILDPACLLEDDPGIAPEQLPDLDRYRAMHEHCPQCGQELGTKDTLAAKILRGDVVV